MTLINSKRVYENATYHIPFLEFMKKSVCERVYDEKRVYEGVYDVNKPFSRVF